MTTRHDKLVEHKDQDHFIVNIYALHNATLLRKALPRELTKPEKLYNNRKAHHTTIAQTLRVTQDAKQVRTQEKRKATLAAKQAQKRKQAEALENVTEGIPESEDEVLEGDSERSAKCQQIELYS